MSKAHRPKVVDDLHGRQLGRVNFFVHHLPIEVTNSRRAGEGTLFMKKLVFIKADACPWCNKSGIDAVVRKKSVRLFCSNNCGYTAPIPKKMLTQVERRKYYGNHKRMKPKSNK